MPHHTLKLLPGIDLNKTEALNEAGISFSQLIRFRLDAASGIALVQKLGGWLRVFPSAFPAIVRALWAWQDTNKNKYLAIGCEPSTVSGVNSPLLVLRYRGGVSTGSLNDITPHVLEDNVAVAVTTLTTTNLVTIKDVGSNITAYDSVYIRAHISVGGVILFGFYPAIAVSPDTYQILLVDQFGNPDYPTAAVTNGGAVAAFTTTSGLQSVNVLLDNHGYNVGDTYPILVSTAVGGVVLAGNTLVQEVIDANNFVVFAPNVASSSATVSINGGDARYDYYLGFGPLPTGTGFGIGGFGRGGFGTGIPPIAQAGANIATLDWVLDNWGEILIALPTDTQFGSIDGTTYNGGPLFYWSPEANTSSAIAIANGPVASTSFFVAMPQRQIIALGTTFNGVQDPLLIRWCDVNDFLSSTAWVASPTNEAGQYRIPRGSIIVGGLQANQQGLIWTDVGLWAMQYIGVGDPNASVYGFNEIGRGCGLIAKKAMGTLAGITYWMGGTETTAPTGSVGSLTNTGQFFSLSGSGVTIMDCPVWDAVFQNLDRNNLYKIRCAVNSSFNEVTWYYPSASGGGEVDSYVKYTVNMNAWDYGLLGRTAWIDQSVLGQPIGADPNKFVQQHEIAYDADGQPLVASFQTGYFTMNDGEFLTFVDQFWPDMKWGPYGSTPNAQVLLTFFVVEYPGKTPRQYGPFTLSQATTYVTPRFRGRLVSLLFQSVDVGTFWRIGANRYRFNPDGKFL